MSADPTAERASILTEAKTLCGGRVYDSLPDDTLLVRDSNGIIKPYIIVGLGQPVMSGADRSLMDEDVQPIIQPVMFECWAITGAIAQDTAGAVRSLFLGFHPTTNSSGLALRGGGSYSSKDTNGRPSRFLETVTFAMTMNLSTP